MPHQGIVALCVSLLSVVITLGIVTAIFRDEKKHQQSNRDDH